MGFSRADNSAPMNAHVFKCLRFQKPAFFNASGQEYEK